MGHIGLTVNAQDDQANRVWILSHDPDLATPFEGMEASPTPGTIVNYIKNVIDPNLAKDGGPLFLVFIGPATPGIFYLHGPNGQRSEIRGGDDPAGGGDITYANDLFQTIRQQLSTTSRLRQKVVVWGSPCAASIVPDIKASKFSESFSRWTTIAGSGPSDPAVHGPSTQIAKLGIDDVAEGDFFVPEFFRSLALKDNRAVGQGSDIFKAYVRAAQAVFQLSRRQLFDVSKGKYTVVRPVQWPQISLGSSAGLNEGNRAGIFNFPLFTVNSGATATYLTLDHFDQVIDPSGAGKAIPTWSGDNEADPRPKLRTRLYLQSGYHKEEDLTKTRVLAYARPATPAPAPSTFTAYHMDPGFAGVVTSSTGPATANSVSADWDPRVYADLNEKDGIDFASNGFGATGQWDLFVRAYRDTGNAPGNPNSPWEVFSTIDHGGVIVGRYSTGSVAGFSAGDSNVNDTGPDIPLHNPVDGGTISTQIPTAFRWGDHAAYIKGTDDIHEVHYLLEFWRNTNGQPDDRLLSLYMNKGIAGGVLDRNTLDLLLAGLGGGSQTVYWSVRAVDNLGNWNFDSKGPFHQLTISAENATSNDRSGIGAK
jgi:hypothetical protein